MNIALVARHATPPQSDVLDPHCADQATHVNELCRALAAQGHDVVVYARKDAPELPDRMHIAPRLRAEFIHAGPASTVPPDQLPRYAGDIASYLATRWSTNAPDLVHAFGWTNGLAVLSATRERPLPLVQTFGSLASAQQRLRIVGADPTARVRMESCIARAATSVLASTSDEVAELAKLGVPSARVTLVPAGVDVGLFKPTRYAAKRPSEPTLIAVGSLAEYRGLEILLRCLSELPGAQLVIAGGPSADELEADHGYRILAKLAAQLGISDRVRFTGHVADQDLPALLRSADLLVSAARYEPQGITAIRAMACGIPVVATAVGAYRDAVIDGTTGVLVPPDRPGLLAKRLRDLLAYPMRTAAFGIAAADRAKSRYPWDRIARETVAAYERTIAMAPTAKAAPPAGIRAAGGRVVDRRGPTGRAPASRSAVRSTQRRTDARQSARSQPAFAPVGGHAA